MYNAETKEKANDGKKLGFGFMRLPLTDPNDPGSVDEQKVNKMVDMYIDAGFNYIDTSWIYHKYKSEEFVRKCVVDRFPRGELQISSKMPIKFIKNATIEKVDDVFHTQMKSCGVDYFDTYLMHGINRASYETAQKIGCFEYMNEKVKQGVIGRFGASTHDDPEFLEMMLNDHPEIEFVYLQVNYLDWDNPTIASREMCEVARKHGKYILVMEPVKGGLLAKVPPEAEKLMKDYNPEASVASWAIRFAASAPAVDRVMSGMSTIEQVADNIKTMRAFKPLNEEELTICKQVAEIIHSKTEIPCTHCNYCLSKCPKHIPISDFFTLENDFYLFEPGHIGGFGGKYQNLCMYHGARAGDCIECKQCESVCPQQLPIHEYLKIVSKNFDGWSIDKSHGTSENK